MSAFTLIPKAFDKHLRNHPSLLLVGALWMLGKVGRQVGMMILPTLAERSSKSVNLASGLLEFGIWNLDRGLGLLQGRV